MNYSYSLLPPVWGSPAAQPASDAAPEPVASVPQNPRNHLPINDNNNDSESEVIDLTQDSEEEEEVVEDVQEASKHGADKDDDANVSVEELDNTLSPNNDKASSPLCNNHDTEESPDSANDKNAASSQASISFETQLPEESAALEVTKKPAASNEETEMDSSAEQESSKESSLEGGQINVSNKHTLNDNSVHGPTENDSFAKSSSEGGRTSISNKDTLNDSNVHEPTESDSEESNVVTSETSTEMKSETQSDEEVPGGVGTHMSYAKSTRNKEQSNVEDDVEVVAVVVPKTTSGNTRQIKSTPAPKKKPAKEAKHQAGHNGVVRETRQRRAKSTKPSDPSLTWQSLPKKATRSAGALERGNSKKPDDRVTAVRKGQPKVAPSADSPDNAGDYKNLARYGKQPFEDLKEDDVVFAMWPKDKLFYWGKIGPKGKHDINTNTYTVLFEDEQYAKNIPRRNIFTHEECVLLWGIKGLPTKLQRMEVRSQDFEKLQLLRRQQPAANPQPVANQQHSSNQQPAAKRQKRFARWDRCYAKWRGGNWYWGRVESVDHRNPEPRYSVIFDDNDRDDAVPQSGILSEEEYEALKPDARYFQRLLEGACKQCIMCKRKECGHCMSCLSNSSRTSPERKLCLFKMCQKLSVSSKSVPIPFGDGVCVFIVPPENPENADLADGVRFVKGGKEYTDIGKVIEEGDPGSSRKDEISQQYEELLFTNNQQTVASHCLSGKRIVRRWMDHSFKVRTVVGKVVECWKIPQRDDTVAEIEYLDPSLSFVTQKMAPTWTIMPRDKMPENQAWGSSNTATVPPKIVAEKWLVPDSVDDFPDYPRRELIYDNNIIELERRISDIGPGAGYGVFCRVKPMISSAKTEFVLRQGEYLDLGIYGPLRPEDVIDRKEWIAKTFVFDSKPEVWSFAKSIEDTGECYDITENDTGDLHELAKRNVLVYVNETDGKERATVQALHDPFSHVHYLLGCHEEALKLSFGTWTELKIDYETAYENVRIREGYSRLKGETLEKKKVDMREDDSLLDMEHWSVCDLEGSLKFLERLDYRAIMKLKPKVRSLVFAMCLRNCLLKIMKIFKNVDTSDPTTFCDNGFSKIKSWHLMDRMNATIQRILEFLSEEELRRSFVGDPDGARFVPFLAEFLQVSKRSIFTMSGAELQSKILESVVSDGLLM